MTRHQHDHMLKQPGNPGFPGIPGYPALPAASWLCRAIADGCAECQEEAVDLNAGDAHVGSVVIAYTADLVANAHGRTLPHGLGAQPTRPGAVVPGPDFVAAATAAFNAEPAACAGNGVPAARAALDTLSDERRGNALADAVGLLKVYQARTERGQAALLALAPPS